MAVIAGDVIVETDRIVAVSRPPNAFAAPGSPMKRRPFGTR
jgi:hypothetical protein